MPKINLNLVEDFDLNLLGEANDDDKDDNEDDKDDNEDNTKENNKVDLEYSIEEIKDLNYNEEKVKSFDELMLTNYCVKSKNYYTYVNCFLDSNKNRRYFYSGKGINNRILDAHLIAYCCLKLKVPPTTQRIKFIISLLKDKKEINLIKTNENLGHSQALAIESCAFKIDFGFKQSNIYDTSFDLSKTNLKKDIFREVNIRTIKNLIKKLDQNDYLVINEEFLEEKFDEIPSLFKRISDTQLTEEKIRAAIYFDDKYNVDLLSAKKN